MTGRFRNRDSRRSQLTGAIALGVLCASLALAPGVWSAPSSPAERAALERVADDPRLDPRLGARLRLGGEERPERGPLAKGAAGVAVILRGDVSRTDLEAAGVVVGTEAGRITTADVPIAAIPALLATPGVEMVEAAGELSPLLNVSGPETESYTAWQYVPPASFTGSTGKNVIIGIVDTGIDLANADFRTPSGQSRIKYVWDQTGFGSPPSGFAYGTEWTQSQISNGSASATDTDGHGTHIAGAAAGNGRATGNGYPAYRYIGMAPEADLVVVKAFTLPPTNFIESKVIDAVNYVFQKAALLGKDAVVLLAMGHHRGGHDGTNSFDQALSALTGPGRVIVAAAGNDGGLPIHSSINLASGGSATIRFSIPTYVPTITLDEYLEIEGWHEPTASFKVRLTSPTGISTNWVNPGASTGLLPTADGGILVQNAQVANSKGAKKIYVFLNDLGDNISPRAGTWTLEIQRQAGTTSGRLDAWITASLFGTTLESPAFTNFVDPSRLVRSPATADSIISAGAYTTKSTWTNANGSASFYTENPTLFAIAPFSSPGPRRDGVQRPDIAAPGYGVMAGLSANESTTNVWKAEDGAHAIRRGTSAAAAHVAGAVAVLLQQSPRLTPSATRTILKQRADSDAFTGSVPNGTWGWGKLSLAPQVGTPVDSGPIEGPPGSGAAAAAVVAYPNPTRGAITFEFSLAAADLGAASTEVRVRIVDVQGRKVGLVSGVPAAGPQRLTWDGFASNGEAASPGVYLARLEGVRKPAVWKFVRMR